MRFLITLSLALAFSSQLAYGRTYACWAQCLVGYDFNTVVLEGAGQYQGRTFVHHTTAANIGSTQEEHGGHVGLGVDRTQAATAAIKACKSVHNILDSRGRVIGPASCYITDCVGER